MRSRTRVAVFFQTAAFAFSGIVLFFEITDRVGNPDPHVPYPRLLRRADVTCIYMNLRAYDLMMRCCEIVHCIVK